MTSPRWNVIYTVFSYTTSSHLNPLAQKIQLLNSWKNANLSTVLEKYLSVCYKFSVTNDVTVVAFSAWCCRLGGRKSIWSVKTEQRGAGVVICLERDANLHITQLMPLPLSVYGFSKIQIGFSFLVPGHPGSPEKGAVKWVCVCAQWCNCGVFKHVVPIMVFIVN